MADVIITPASGLIDFENVSGISSATIQLDGNGNLVFSAAGGDIQIGDTSADIFIGDGINNVDLIFEEDGEIRGLTGKTITLGQSDSFISFAGDITGNVDFTGTLTAGQNGKIVFPDNTTVPDDPTNQQHDYITFGANGSISQVSGRGALLFTSSDDSMVIANGDVGRAFTNSNIDTDPENIFILSDGNFYVKTDLQEGFGTEHTLLFDNAGGFSLNGNTIWHAGNDGSGSGLDADLLDGKHKPLNWGNDAYAGSVYTSSVNADSYRIVGSSVFMSSSSNTPNNTGHLWTVAGGDTANRGIQMFSNNDNTGKMWFRCLNGKTWHNIWTSGNDGSGSGLDADTLDGAQPSVSAGNNTIVQRHSSGYIFANYFNTTPNDVSSGVTKICCETGNDGYIRHATPDAVRGFIDDGRYLRSDATDSFSGTITNSGNFISLAGSASAANFNKIRLGRSTSQFMSFFGDSGGSNMIAVSSSGNPKANVKVGYSVDGGATVANTYTFTGSSGTVWTSGNDGSGSGLDADTVDGVQGASFLRSDANDTASGTITFNGTVNFRNAVDLADNDILRFGSGDDAEFFCNGSHFYLDLNSGIGNFYIRDGTTTRFTFDDAGSFTATSNITAYSDINLKKNIEVIPNALDKVSQIRGVTFDRIDLEDESRQSGVIAQEVEKVLPEVVRTTQDGTKTVAYGNMVGLLIEAIKEQQKQIDDLRSKLEEGN